MGGLSWAGSVVFSGPGACAVMPLGSCGAAQLDWLVRSVGGALVEQRNWRLHKPGWELNARIQVGIFTSKEKAGGLWLAPGIPVRAAMPPDQRVLGGGGAGNGGWGVGKGRTDLVRGAH